MYNVYLLNCSSNTKNKTSARSNCTECPSKLVTLWSLDSTVRTSFQWLRYTNRNRSKKIQEPISNHHTACPTWTPCVRVGMSRYDWCYSRCLMSWDLAFITNSAPLTAHDIVYINNFYIFSVSAHIYMQAFWFYHRTSQVSSAWWHCMLTGFFF